MAYFVYPFEDNGGGGGTLLPLAPITLSSGNIATKTVSIGVSPTTPTLTRLSVGGVRQLYATDFTVSGSTLSWSGLGLDGILEAGDIIQIEYA
jgi:hypothetical protein